VACVLDAFALVALALEEPAAAEVEAALRRGDCVVSAVNLAEAIDQLGRVRGRSAGELRTEFSGVLGETLAVQSVGEQLAWRAADLRRRHYRRRSSELSLADCLALATAREGDRLATADPPLARATRSEGLEVLALPGTDGQRP
jgi:uncharacterized protein with PIN domain